MDYQRLSELKSALEQHYSTMHQKMKECSAFYNNEFTVEAWKDTIPYKPPSAKNKVDVAVDHIMAIGRRVSVPEFGSSIKDKETAGRVQRFGQGLLNTLEKSQSFNPVRMIVKQGILYGMYCLKGPIFIESLWPHRPNLVGVKGKARERMQEEYETARARALPLYTRSVSPINLFPDPAMEQPSFVLEAYKRKKLTILSAWPDMETQLAEYRDMDDLDWWEYWDRNEYWYCVGDKVVFTSENFMGFLPYQIGYSGLGEEAPDGGPEYRAVGLIGPAISALQAEADLKNALVHYLKTQAYTMPSVNQNPAGTGFQMAKAPGEISIIPDELSFQNRAPAAMNPNAFNIIGMIDADIDSATVSPMLEGDKPTGIASGYMGAIFVGQARVRLEGIVSSVENTLGKYLESVGELVRNVIREPLTISRRYASDRTSETVKPDDFQSSPQFEVRFDGDTPEERDRRFDQGLRALAARALSWETIASKFFNIDAADERKRMMVEEVMKNPSVYEAMSQAALQDAGMDRFLSMARDVKERKATKPQPGMPGSQSPELQRLGPLGRPTELNSPMEQPSYEPR